MLEWLAYKFGHGVMYGVRFHCECAPVESLWAYVVYMLRDRLDGTPGTLLALLAEYFAWAVKPDVSARLFNRPTECWLLYTLAVVSKPSLEAGLSAPDVVDLQRAFSGYSNRPRAEIGSAHPRASAAGCDSDAVLLPFNLNTLEEEGGELDEVVTLAPPRSFVTQAPLVAAGGAAAGAPPALGTFVHAEVPEGVPFNLWELLSCIKEKARRDITDKRQKDPKIWSVFVAAVQRVWNTPTGRDVLSVLDEKTLADITVEFALKHSIVLYVGVRANLSCEPCPPDGDGGAAAGLVAA